MLASPVKADRDVPLALSAARWRVTNVEKLTTRGILHDDKVHRRVMSTLVRVRLICAGAIRILDAALGFSSANRREFSRIFHRFA